MGDIVHEERGQRTGGIDMGGGSDDEDEDWGIDTLYLEPGVKRKRRRGARRRRGSPPDAADGEDYPTIA